jgi:hypothetical protein
MTRRKSNSINHPLTTTGQPPPNPDRHDLARLLA